MQTKTEIHILKCGKYSIETSAVLIESLWYPTYQVLEHGVITAPWQIPARIGCASKENATRAAFQYAMDDLDFGKRHVAQP